MTAVIRYRTPFFVINKDTLILSFKLDKEISLYSVLVLPPLLSMGATINLPLWKIICSELNFTFPLLLDPLGKELSDGVSISGFNLCVSPGVSFNLTSLVQYTTMDVFANQNINQTTPSDNIAVQRSFYHGSVSRYLSIATTSKHTVT